MTPEDPASAAQGEWSRPFRAHWVGTVPYGRALRLQESLVERRRRGEVPDTLLLLEHPPVITLGRNARPEHVLLEPEEAVRLGVEIHVAGRGGGVTYHGPGQLVGYPILALPPGRRDVHRYLRDLEEVLLRVARHYGVPAQREPGLTGVWVGGRKLAALGVRLCRGWITCHGFAFNVGADLGGFRWIVPCGIRDRGVTSLSLETGLPLEPRALAPRVARAFAEVFGQAKSQQAWRICA